MNAIHIIVELSPFEELFRGPYCILQRDRGLSRLM